MVCIYKKYEIFTFIVFGIVMNVVSYLWFQNCFCFP